MNEWTRTHRACCYLPLHQSSEHFRRKNLVVRLASCHGGSTLIRIRCVGCVFPGKMSCRLRFYVERVSFYLVKFGRWTVQFVTSERNGVKLVRKVRPVWQNFERKSLQTRQEANEKEQAFQTICHVQWIYYWIYIFVQSSSKKHTLTANL